MVKSLRIFGLIAFGVWAACAFKVLAHTAPDGWKYEMWCCGGNDCARIPAKDVQVMPDGFHVTIQPGEHPLVTDKTFFEIVPYDAAPRGRPTVQEPKDEYYHVCIVSGKIRCLYPQRWNG